MRVKLLERRRRQVRGRRSFPGERALGPGLLPTELPGLQILGYHGDWEGQCLVSGLMQESREILQDQRYRQRRNIVGLEVQQSISDRYQRQEGHQLQQKRDEFGAKGGLLTDGQRVLYSH